MIEYACGFLFRNNWSEVALITKNKPAFLAGHLNGIGGKMEPGETALQAMEREFAEEAAWNCRGWREFVNLRIAGTWDLVHFFVLHDDDAQINSMEEEPVAWYKVEDVLRLETAAPPLPNLRWLIPMAMDRNTVQADVEETVVR